MGQLKVVDIVSFFVFLVFFSIYWCLLNATKIHLLKNVTFIYLYFQIILDKVVCISVFKSLKSLVKLVKQLQ